MIAYSQDRKIICPDTSRFIWKVLPASELVENDGSPIKGVQPYEWVICCGSSSNDVEVFATYESEAVAKDVLYRFANSMLEWGSYKFPQDRKG